jgi:hypothetical protein
MILSILTLNDRFTSLFCTRCVQSIISREASVRHCDLCFAPRGLAFLGPGICSVSCGNSDASGSNKARLTSSSRGGARANPTGGGGGAAPGPPRTRAVGWGAPGPACIPRHNRPMASLVSALSIVSYCSSCYFPNLMSFVPIDVWPPIHRLFSWWPTLRR